MRLPVPGLRSPRAVALAAAALVTLAGLALVLLGLARATVWAPERVTVARVAGQAGAPIVTTTPAATTLDGPELEIQVRGPSDRQVFVGIGRADDVSAYLGGVARTEVTGAGGGQGVMRREGTEASLPEPSGVDVWALRATGTGTATLTWTQVPGRWRVVAAVDGATPPTEVTLTWQRARASSSAPALLSVGGLLLVLGLVGAWAARRSLAATPAAPPFAGPPAPRPGSRTPSSLGGPAAAPTPGAPTAGAPTPPAAPTPGAPAPPAAPTRSAPIPPAVPVPPATPTPTAPTPTTAPSIPAAPVPPAVPVVRAAPTPAPVTRRSLRATGNLPAVPPATRPGGEHPAGERPRSEHPAGERPRSERPAGERLRTERPAGERSAPPPAGPPARPSRPLTPTPPARGAGDVDDDDEPEADIAPAPFRQPPRGTS